MHFLRRRQLGVGIGLKHFFHINGLFNNKMHRMLIAV